MHVKLKYIKLDATHIIPIGEPKKRETRNGITIEVTDDLGLPMDGRYYAKSSCNTCYGRGVYCTVRPAAMHSCPCAQKRYRSVREFVSAHVVSDAATLASAFCTAIAPSTVVDSDNEKFTGIDRTTRQEPLSYATQPLTPELLELAASLVK